jgi:hypothetical protein
MYAPEVKYTISGVDEDEGEEEKIIIDSEEEDIQHNLFREDVDEFSIKDKIEAKEEKTQTIKLVKPTVENKLFQFTVEIRPLKTILCDFTPVQVEQYKNAVTIKSKAKIYDPFLKYYKGKEDLITRANYYELLDRPQRMEFEKSKEHLLFLLGLCTIQLNSVDDEKHSISGNEWQDLNFYSNTRSKTYENRVYHNIHYRINEQINEMMLIQLVQLSLFQCECNQYVPHTQCLYEEIKQNVLHCIQLANIVLQSDHSNSNIPIGMHSILTRCLKELLLARLIELCSIVHPGYINERTLGNTECTSSSFYTYCFYYVLNQYKIANNVYDELSTIYDLGSMTLKTKYSKLESIWEMSLKDLLQKYLFHYRILRFGFILNNYSMYEKKSVAKREYEQIVFSTAFQLYDDNIYIIKKYYDFIIMNQKLVRSILRDSSTDTTQIKLTHWIKKTLRNVGLFSNPIKKIDKLQNSVCDGKATAQKLKNMIFHQASYIDAKIKKHDKPMQKLYNCITIAQRHYRETIDNNIVLFKGLEKSTIHNMNKTLYLASLLYTYQIHPNSSQLRTNSMIVKQVEQLRSYKSLEKRDGKNKSKEISIDLENEGVMEITSSDHLNMTILSDMITNNKMAQKYNQLVDEENEKVNEGLLSEMSTFKWTKQNIALITGTYSEYFFEVTKLDETMQIWPYYSIQGIVNQLETSSLLFHSAMANSSGVIQKQLGLLRPFWISEQTIKAVEDSFKVGFPIENKTIPIYLPTSHG